MKKKEIGLLILLLALDFLSKELISSTMTLGQSIPVIQGFFNITYVVNTGAAWSILEGRMLFFYIMTIIACAIIGWMLIKTDKRAIYTRLGLVSILAGALGNFIDRLMYQHVRDFLDFTIFGYDFPVFNVADMALCLGVFVTLVIVLLKKEELNESV